MTIDLKILNGKFGKQSQKHITVSFYVEKFFDKIQHPFIIKSMEKIEIKRTYFMSIFYVNMQKQFIANIYTTPT